MTGVADEKLLRVCQAFAGSWSAAACWSASASSNSGQAQLGHVHGLSKAPFFVASSSDDHESFESTLPHCEHFRIRRAM
jgi:hypothetical protein